MSIKIYNPTTSRLMAEYTFMSESLISNKLQLNQSANLAWRAMDTVERSFLLNHLAEKMEARKHYFATLITLTMGKPITSALSEVDKCCLAIRYFAEYGPAMLAPEVQGKSYKILQPLGSILLVMPWNYPLWQVVRVLAPNLILGNGLVLCHAPNVYIIAKALEELIDGSDLPSGLLVSILQEYNKTQALINSEYVQGLAFTGSDEVGALLAGYAGAALKPSTVECGGSDPYLVLPDADIDLAAETIVAMRMNNSGQVCISAKRIIVVSEVYDDFLDLVVGKVAKIVYADPMLDTTIMGPLARSDIRDKLHMQVELSISEGAECIIGGVIPDEEGYFYPPTILTQVNSGMTVFKEEVFGPVLVIIKANSVEHALELANSHKYGLGAVVFTRDHVLGYDLSLRLRAGVCAINKGISSDPSLPFGGIGRSGYGRELGLEGVRAFSNIKVVSGC